MRPTTALGQYLRARRELVRPEDVGLAKFGRRRVPGLRREELATLAGISSDYYLRLEQGRDHHPSAQVIDALARARLSSTNTPPPTCALSRIRPRPSVASRSPSRRRPRSSS
jgi:transcriptional regulator with XRE-family HTH domain